MSEHALRGAALRCRDLLRYRGQVLGCNPSGQSRRFLNLDGGVQELRSLRTIESAAVAYLFFSAENFPALRQENKTIAVGRQDDLTAIVERTGTGFIREH